MSPAEVVKDAARCRCTRHLAKPTPHRVAAMSVGRGMRCPRMVLRVPTHRVFLYHRSPDDPALQATVRTRIPVWFTHRELNPRCLCVRYLCAVVSFLSLSLSCLVAWSWSGRSVLCRTGPDARGFSMHTPRGKTVRILSCTRRGLNPLESCWWRARLHDDYENNTTTIRQSARHRHNNYLYSTV